ncbi:hypothetical protein VNI00_014577 [Paramarasmius palmivorus]|uniref:FAD-binding FR-type domain-containing protein n=1 Tax=Paramarasmius palmivorus TaxID=297713 RepID=A0AAW0BT57_9AGAR
MRVWDSDPLIKNASGHFTDDGNITNVNHDMLVAGIGIDFPTRRRSKFAGKISKLCRRDDTFDMEVFVNESIANCPKYINARDLIPHPNTVPRVKYRQLHLSLEDQLPKGVVDFIQKADTVFFGTTYASTTEKDMYPSHVGMNQRGGRPGFVRVSSKDKRTVILPDYSGNRIMTSLGNIEATPLASLSFVSFESGDVLYLTGTAENLYGAEARNIMMLQNRLTKIYVTGFVYVEDALTVRQRPGILPERSPYSPPIKFLIEECSNLKLFDEEDSVKAVLSSVDLHSENVATFTWESSKELGINPGQAIILDLAPFLGTARYQHMAPRKPSSVNDNHIRTWTVSSAHPMSATRTFSLTVKLRPGGLATGALFSIAHKLAELKPELLTDSRPLELGVRILGVTGEFGLPDIQAKPDGSRKCLWIAGGIGITPFLSMLRGIGRNKTRWDIIFIISTREPDVFISIISSIWKQLVTENAQRIVFRVTLFSNQNPASTGSFKLDHRRRRLSAEFFVKEPSLSDAGERDVLICGTPEFEQVAISGLGEIGVSPDSIRREK